VPVPESYQGWVNLGDSDDPAERPRDNYNTTDFSSATIYGDGTVWFCDKARSRAMRYKPQSNTIYIARAHPVEMGQAFQDVGRSMELAVSLDALRSDWNLAGLAAQHSVDNGTDCYVIQYSATRVKAFWFNPATKRLVKTQGQTDGKSWTQYYRYNSPAIAEIHDLGVPRNAKIVDHRPTGELKDVLDRIDARVNTGFGDCVGVMTETPLDSTGRTVPNAGQFTLFAHDGPKWMEHRFLAGGQRVPTRRTTGDLAPLIPLPAGWPTPQVSSLIAPLGTAIPNDAYVSDGIHAWRVEFQAINNTAARLTDVGTDYGTGAHAKAWFSIPGQIWPGSEALFTFNPENNVRLKRDRASHDGLIGILAEEDLRSHELWIDPSRDDVPIEYIQTRHDGPGSTMEERRQFDRFAQLPGGRWYPTRWKYTISYKRTAVSDTQATLLHLRIDPQLRLESKWFGDPIARLVGVKATNSR
jgi:hypothetical protein